MVPNGVDPEWLEKRPRATALAQRWGVGSGPVFAYIGSFSHCEGRARPVDGAPDNPGRLPGARPLPGGGGADDGALPLTPGTGGPGALVSRGRDHGTGARP